MKSEAATTLPSKWRPGMAATARLNAAPGRSSAMSASRASICTHRLDGSLTTKAAGAPGPDWSGRSSWPGLRLRSTTTPAMLARRDTCWFTLLADPYSAVLARVRSSSVRARALSVSAASRSLRGAMPASNSSFTRVRVFSAACRSMLARTASAWACPKSGEASSASGVPGATGLPRSASTFTTRPAKTGKMRWVWSSFHTSLAGSSTVTLVSVVTASTFNRPSCGWLAARRTVLPWITGAAIDGAGGGSLPHPASTRAADRAIARTRQGFGSNTRPVFNRSGGIA